MRSFFRANVTIMVLVRLLSAGAALTDPATVQIEDEVCFEGFIMDNYCIELGTLLDNPSADTLVNPEKHSVHCLVDVDECRASNYEILAEPADGQSMFTRAFKVDDSGKADLIALARSVGRCGTCTGENGTLKKGFRAEVNGVVTALADGETPATLRVTSAAYSNDKSTICGVNATRDENAAGGGNASVDQSSSADNSNDIAIKVVSTLSVVAAVALAALSLYAAMFEKKK